MALFHTTVVDNQIKALDTIGTASGSIATFDTDRAENLINLEVAITATGGGGTPVSPIAINGFSQADISVCGKNLNAQSSQYIYINLKAGDTIYIKNNYPNALTFILYFRFTDETTDQISMTNGGSYTYTLSKDLVRMAISPSVYTAFETYGSTLFISKEDTTIEPFNGTTETISFGQTVYGGRLNVGSGVLTITHGYICLYDYNWQYNSGFAVFETGEIHGKYYPSEFICTDYACSMVSSVGAIPNNSGLLRQTAMYIKNTDYTDATQFKNSLTNTYMVYELATPLTIQLDSKQIQAIIGTNNIYADTGDIIDLKFVLSVGKAIS